MKYGDRVVTDTKFNRAGVGTGNLIGLEVYKGNNCVTIKDHEEVNKLLDYGFDGRYIVRVFDRDDSVKEMFGTADLCFYQSDNVRPFWETLSDGEEYCFRGEINGIEYWLPNDETLTIRVRHKESGLEKDTDFYEMDDFEYPDSDYAYVLKDGKLMCKFEAEED